MNRLVTWLLFVAVLISPNLLYVFRSTFFGGFWDGLQFILFALATILIVVSLLPMRSALLILVPLLFLVPAAVLHVSILGSPISKGMILSSVYSSMHEVTTVLATKPAMTAFSFLLLSVGLAAAYRLVKGNLDFPWRRKLQAAGIVLGLYTIVSIPVDARNTATGILEYPRWKFSLLIGSRTHGPFSDLFPVGLGSRVARVAVDIITLHRWQEQRARTEWAVRRNIKAPESELHVVVIGESSRRDHWQLYGYARPTTPFVSAEPRIFAFSDVISPANLTINAVIQLMSKATPGEIQRAYNEPSIIVAFKKAGFKTFWVSNSEMIGQFSTPITMIANDSDQSSFLANINADTMDGVLVDEFTKVLQDPAPKKLVVMHMKGSHAEYKDRYTHEFDRFQPSQFGRDVVDWSKRDRDEMINTYDNSLLYTDDILGRTIKQLKALPGHAGLTYVSDHGERLMDNGSRDIGHPSALGTREELEIPFFVWLNTAYIEQNPERVANLEKNKKLPMSSLVLFDTLLGLTGMDIAGHSKEKDIFAPDFKGTSRPVLLPNGEVRDYDKDILQNTGH